MVVRLPLCDTSPDAWSRSDWSTIVSDGSAGSSVSVQLPLSVVSKGT